MYEDTPDDALAELLRYNAGITNNPAEELAHRNEARRRMVEIQSEQRRRRIEAKPTLIQSALAWFDRGGDAAKAAI